MGTPVLLAHDYTRSQFRYSDGSMVYLTPHQSTLLLGITLIQPFRAMATGNRATLARFSSSKKVK